MEPKGDFSDHHEKRARSNIVLCDREVRRWIGDPTLPSSQMVPLIHRELMEGVETYSEKGLTPIEPGESRKVDLRTGGSPENFYVRGMDVEPVLRAYYQELDRIGNREVATWTKIAETIHDAAWAYYVFGRIHPFLDGNGRTGRKILKKVIKSRGLKEIVFEPARDNEKARDSHLNALSATDSSGNLAHVELYLATLLRLRYLAPGDREIRFQIDTVCQKRREEITAQKSKRPLTDIWEGFRGLDMYNVEQEEYPPAG